MSMVLCIRKTDIPNIRFDMHTAWASALLILGRGQCEGLTSGMSDEFRFPRFFMWIWVITDQIPCRESAEEHKKEHE